MDGDRISSVVTSTATSMSTATAMLGQLGLFNYLIKFFIYLTSNFTLKTMKKIVIIFFISALIFSCAQAPKESAPPESKDPLSGVFTSRDSKAQTLFSNMNLFANADFSYVNKLLTEDFTLRTSGDTGIAATGREDVIKYWNGIHGIYEDISFSKGRLQTFELNTGEVWSAYFGDLYAKGKFSKENYAIPINVWIQWENDKIIHQVDMLDSKFITAEIEAGNLN
jgi:hypothetical protein